jgi:hypothetical protein
MLDGAMRFARQPAGDREPPFTLAKPSAMAP